MPSGVYIRKIKPIPPNNTGKHFKLSEETKRRMSKAKKGQIPWNKGEKGIYSKEYINKISKSNKGKHNLRGKDCWWSWKGGKTDLNLLIRKTFKYRQWRSDVFTRDDYTCQKCGQRGYKLVVHHIKFFKDIINEYNIKNSQKAIECEELWNINNGITLCDKCHIKLHKHSR